MLRYEMREAAAGAVLRYVESCSDNEEADTSFIYGKYDPVVITSQHITPR